MKKKAIALAMSMMLFSSIASAAPSVTAEVVPTLSQAMTSSGTVIAKEDLTVTAVQDVSKLPAEVAAKLEKAHQDIISAASVSDFLSNAGLTASVEKAIQAISNTVKAEDLTVHSLFDVSATGAAKAELEANGSVSIGFTVPELQAGQVAVVLHLAESGWEVVPSTIENGVVTATFTSLSPVVLMVQDTAAATASSARTMTSPQTGYAGFEGALIGGVLVGAAVLGYSVKRRIEN